MESSEDIMIRAFEKYQMQKSENHLEHEKSCKICNVTMNAGKSELVRHSQTAKHLRKSKSIQSSCDIRQLIDNQNDPHLENVKKAEIKLTAFFASNNIAIHLIDQLEPLLKHIFFDSKICKDLSIKRTKCTEILKNVLCEKETQSLVTHLQQNKFSILVDESTDLTDTKTLAVLTRYISNAKVETRLLKLVELDSRELGATELFNKIHSCLDSFGIPINNIVGFASDGASVMVGKNHSVFQLLKKQVPHVILQRCICHSAALVASKACSVLPQELEEVIKGIYSYISGSTKRTAQFREIQEFFNLQQLKILKLSNTRWLSRHECVTRILKNWTAIQHFFIMAVHEDRTKTAEFILSELQKPATKAYLTFLKYILNIFNSFNRLFQNKKPLIHVLYRECMSLMMQLCKNYMDPAVLFQNSLASLDLAYPRHFLPIEKLFVGPECDTEIQKMSKEDKHYFLLNCQKFYIAAAVDLQKRLPDEIFNEMRFLDPEITFSQKESERIVNFSILCDKFSGVFEFDMTENALEWRKLPDTFSSSKIENLKNLPIDEMWMEITNNHTYDNTLAFPHLKKLVSLILIQPHSNADTERIFSIVTDAKTKKRNRLGETSLNAICVFKSMLQATNQSVVDFKVDEAHLKLFTKSMYSFTKTCQN